MPRVPRRVWWQPDPVAAPPTLARRPETDAPRPNRTEAGTSLGLIPRFLWPRLECVPRELLSVTAGLLFSWREGAGSIARRGTGKSRRKSALPRPGNGLGGRNSPAGRAIILSTDLTGDQGTCCPMNVGICQRGVALGVIATRPTPEWHLASGELRWNGEVIRKYGHQSATSQAPILTAFQAAGWEVSIPNPFLDELPPDQREKK